METAAQIAIHQEELVKEQQPENLVNLQGIYIPVAVAEEEVKYSLQVLMVALVVP